MAYSLYVKTDSGYTPLSIESSSGTSTTGSYLPLSGGTMTGAIRWTVAGQGTGAFLYCSADDSKICMTTSKSASNTSGASLTMLGSGYSGTDRTAGSFVLRAHDGSTQVSLMGKADGSLTWNDKSVLCEGDVSSGGLSDAITSVAVGDTSITASGETALTLAAGDGVTLTADAATHTVTIAETYQDVVSVTSLDDVPSTLRVGGLVILEPS